MDAGDRHPMGWWTKRLDVAMRDPSVETDNELESLSQIIQSLPNLNILIFRVTAAKYRSVDLPESFLNQLSRSAKFNLQAIVWYSGALIPDPQQWHTFLSGMYAIRTLSQACVAVHYPTEFSLPALPALRTFSMPYHMRYCPNPIAPIPFLRHFVFSADRSTDRSWKAFLLNHGQQLEVVQVYVIWEHGISHVVDTVSQTCPNLHRLDIAIPTWSQLNVSEDGLSLPATMRTFGLYCMQSQAPKTGYKRLFSALRNMKFGPAFKVIQLLRPTNVVDLCKHHRQLLLDNMPKLRELGFELLDHEGRVLLWDE
jgi:hypothetical protein